MGFPVVTPMLPTIRDAFEISNTLVGWVMTAYGLPALIFIPLAGFLGDRYGKKKIIVPSLFLFGLAGGATMFATSFEALLVLRFLQGIGAGALTTLNIALIGDRYSGGERATVMGYLGSLNNLTSGIFPLIGGFLALIVWFAPFLIFLLAIPAGLWVLFALDSGPPDELRTSGALIGQATTALGDRRVLELILLSAGFIFVGFGAFVTYIPILLSDNFGVNAAVISLLLAPRTVSGVLVSSQFGRLSARFSMRALIGFAFGLMAVTMITVPLVPAAWAVMLTATGYGIAFAIARPGLQYMLLDASPEHLRGIFSAAHGTALRVAQTTAPIFFGLLLLVGGLDIIYIAASAVCLLLLAMTITTRYAFGEE